MDECEGLTPALLGVQHRCGRRLEGVRSRDLWRDPSHPTPPHPTPSHTHTHVHTPTRPMLVFFLDL